MRYAKYKEIGISWLPEVPEGVAKIAVDFFGFVLVYYLRFRELGDKVA